MLNQRKYKTEKRTNTGSHTMTPQHSSYGKPAPAFKEEVRPNEQQGWEKGGNEDYSTKKKESKIEPEAENTTGRSEGFSVGLCL